MKKSSARLRTRIVTMLGALVVAGLLMWLVVSTMTDWQLPEGQQTVLVVFSTVFLGAMLWLVWNESGKDPQ
jgi:hypothetical protein